MRTLARHPPSGDGYESYSLGCSRAITVAARSAVGDENRIGIRVAVPVCLGVFEEVNVELGAGVWVSVVAGLFVAVAVQAGVEMVISVAVNEACSSGDGLHAAINKRKHRKRKICFINFLLMRNLRSS